MVKCFGLILFVFSVIYCVAECGICTDGMQTPERDVNQDSYDVGIQEFVTGNFCSEYGSLARWMVKCVCADANSFCFPLKILGFPSSRHQPQNAELRLLGSEGDGEEPLSSTGAVEWVCTSSWLTGQGMFELVDGPPVCCFTHLETNRPIVDWGQLYIYHPTLVFAAFCKLGATIYLFPYNTSRGKVFGASCIQLQRSLQEHEEARVDSNIIYSGSVGFVSVYDEVLASFGTSDAVVTIYMRKRAPCSLYVVKIRELGCTKYFQIKYIKRLLFLPVSVTQAAVITYWNIPDAYLSSSAEASHMSMTCVVHVLSSTSRNSLINPCEKIINARLRSPKSSSFSIRPLGNKMIGSLDNCRQIKNLYLKAPEMAEVEELIIHHRTSRDKMVVCQTVQVETYCFKWIMVKYPSLESVTVQHILNSGQIIEELRSADGSIQLLPSERFNGSTTQRKGLSVAEGAITEACVHPHDQASFGPILFHPSNQCTWRSSAFIKNNLPGVEWGSLMDYGGSTSLILFEGSEAFQSIEFKICLPFPLNMFLLDMQELTYACSQPLLIEFYFKNVGDWSLEVKAVGISGEACILDGFIIHTCHGFALEPRESTKFIISYQTASSATFVHKDLQLALNIGAVVITINATLPMCTIKPRKRSLFWSLGKRCCVGALLAVFSLFFIFWCIYSSAVAIGTEECVCKNDDSPITSQKVEGKHSHRNLRKSKFPVPSNSLMISAGEGNTWRKKSKGKDLNMVGGSQQDSTSQQKKSALESCIKSNALGHRHNNKSSAAIQQTSVRVANVSSDVQGTSQPSNLTIRTAKEKVRRRRKKRGLVAGLTDVAGVSSSQSENSTPTSPMSPFTFAMSTPMHPLSPAVNKSKKTNRPFSRVVGRNNLKEQVSYSHSEANTSEPNRSVRFHDSIFLTHTQQQQMGIKTYSDAVMIPSASPNVARPYPNAGCFSFPYSRSSVAPHARAPGSEVYKQRTVKLQDKTDLKDGFTYDIWGDHWSTLHLIGKPCESTEAYYASASDSFSFFARGPETIMSRFYPRSENSHQNG